MEARAATRGSDSLRALLGPERVTEAGALLGLEHEYQLSRQGTIVDFGTMIHDLVIPGRRLDPGDRNAYRCGSGLAITADDREAEVASPPLRLGPRFTGSVDSWAHAGRDLLGRILPAGLDVQGFSTHLSAAMPAGDADRVVDLLVQRFAPSLMMVLDRPDSHGIFLRPRPSRMELCGEYVIGSRLRAAAALFTGAVRACAAAGATLPPALAVGARPADGRYGFEVDRHRAFGFDMYDRARGALLPLQDGGTIGAQAHMEMAWDCARAALVPRVAPADLVPMDRIVDGTSPLGVETVSDRTTAACEDPIAPTPFGRLLAPRRRGILHIAPVVATWSFTVFGLREAGRLRFVCVPRESLARFLDLLDTGELDDLLTAHARSPLGGRVLSAFAQTQRAGLWDAIGDPAELLPTERGPVPSSGAAGSKADRTSRGGRRPGKPAVVPAPLLEPPPPPAIQPPVVPLPVEPPGPAPSRPAVAWTPPMEPPPPPPVHRPVMPLPVGPPDVAPSPGRGSRPLAVVAGVLLLAVLGAAFALGLLSGRDDRPIDSVPALTTTIAPVTSTVVATTVDPTTSTSTSSTSSTSTSTTLGPTTSLAPPTTVAVAPSTTTTLPPTTTTVTTTTTTTIPPPTVVTVNNCTFSVANLNTPRGSTIRFRNESPTASITLTVNGPPGSGDVFFSLDPGGLSGPYVLNVTGTYVFQCRGAGTGQLVVTAT